MGSNPPAPAGMPLPPKPWERGGTSGTAPFKPPSPGATSDVVESSGTAKPGEIVPASPRNPVTAVNNPTRPVPSRPWESNYGNSYGGYSSGLNYNSGYGSGMYSSYGGFGGSYGGSGLYGNNMYNRGYGGLYGGSGIYGGNMYSGGYSGPMGGNGMTMGAPYGGGDPNNPHGPSPPPGFWMSFLRVMHGVVDFFGRIAMLVDQNTQAFHMFISALLQLFDRSGMLYGELARFALRLLGIRTKPRKQQQQQLSANASGELPSTEAKQLINVSGTAAAGSWDSVWGQEDGSSV